jgi:hypothetical protein
MSTVGGGKLMPRSAIVSAMIRDTARLRNHLRFAGITNHGACPVLQRLSAASLIFQCLVGSSSRCLKRASCSSLLMCR